MKYLLFFLGAFLAGCSPRAHDFLLGPSLRDQHARALAYGGILSAVNGESLDELALGPVTDEIRRANQAMLAEWWEVKSREDFLATLAWIENGGHRKEFRELRWRLESVPVEHLMREIFKDQKDIRGLGRRFVVAQVLRASRRKGLDIAAWDFEYCRSHAFCSRPSLPGTSLPMTIFLGGPFGPSTKLRIPATSIAKHIGTSLPKENGLRSHGVARSAAAKSAETSILSN